jgi:hypothetical protein
MGSRPQIGATKPKPQPLTRPPVQTNRTSPVMTKPPVTGLTNPLARKSVQTMTPQVQPSTVTPQVVDPQVQTMTPTVNNPMVTEATAQVNDPQYVTAQPQGEFTPTRQFGTRERWDQWRRGRAFLS